MSQVKKLVSWVLAFVMILACVPLDAYAAVYKDESDGNAPVKTTSWAYDEKIGESNNWPLAPGQYPRQISNTAEPMKTPALSYHGYYKRPDGKTVIRLTFRYNSTALTTAWYNLYIKFQSDLAKLVDFQNEDTGIYKGFSKGAVDGWLNDDAAYNQVTKFGYTDKNTAGSDHVYHVSLSQNKNLFGAATNDIPINLVLKDGKSIEDVHDLGEPLVQIRIVDGRNKGVYTDVKNADKALTSYNAYTFGTAIPRTNYRVDSLEDIEKVSYSNIQALFRSANAFVRYNDALGYVEVVHHSIKELVNGKIYDREFAFRQSVDKAFVDVLRGGPNDTVAYIYTKANSASNSGLFDEFGKPKNGDYVIPVKKSAFNFKEGSNTAFIQVANGNFDTSHEYANKIKTITTQTDVRNTLMDPAESRLNYGQSTVVRYYVDKEKFENLAKQGRSLSSFPFYNTFLVENPVGTNEYAFTLDRDVDLKEGEKLYFKFDKDYKSAKRSDNMGMYIEGDDANIFLRSNFNVVPTSRDWSEFTYTLQKGMALHLKKGTKIRLILDRKIADVGKANLTFENDKTKVLHADKHLNYSPIIARNQEVLSAGMIANTVYKPDIDEIFTTDDKITGRSYYGNAEIKIVHPDAKEADKKKAQVILAGGNSKKVTVDGSEYDGYEFDTTKPGKEHSFTMPKLEKDMPVAFTNKDTETLSMESDPPVVEQVQAKVTFDLNGRTSAVGGFGTIERIAPLNKEYKYNPTTGEANPNYKPSGFTGENVKFEDHNGKALQGDNLKRRQMPTGKEINVPEGMRILGWTTKKLTDEPNGKTAAEQFREIKTRVQSVANWEKVDQGQNCIFDEKSPVDKERTVYAVYGEGINLILHSNNTGDPNHETVVTVPITIADIDETNKLIDATSSPTLQNKKNEYVAKKLPKVPYVNNNGTLEGDYDEAMKTFNMMDHSFIGWTAERFTNDPKTSTLRAGNNNERIGQMEQGYVTVNGKKTEILKRTESYSLISKKKFESERAVPNGFAVAFEGNDQNFANIKEMIQKGHDIHLYANYRPFFDVKVIHSFKNIDPKQDIANSVIGEYQDTVDPSKKKDVKIGLLYRTAVTDYGNPTVHADANYYPLKGQVKDWSANGADNLTWKVPGFDELGQRRSYVSAIVTDEKAFNDFSKDNWGALGIKTYVRVDQADGTAIRDKNAPLNIHKDAGNPYGDPLAKDQSYSVGVDAYTSATSRKAETFEVDGEKEVIGYTIYNTSTPIDIPKPVFDPVLDADTQINLHWTDAEKNAGIVKIKLNVPGIGEVELQKQGDGTYAGGGLTATAKGDKLSIGHLNLTGQEGKEITANYVVEKSGVGHVGETGRIAVDKKKTSSAVDSMRQIKNGSDGKAQIQFNIPNPVLNKPTKGTIYEAQKWDKDTNAWVTVGRYEQQSDSEIGSEKTITLDQVNHGDTIRIKTTQPGQNPIDSTGGGDAPYTPEQGQVNKKYITLDRQGPTGEVTAKDEEFRRFVDVSASLDEMPLGRKVTLELETKGAQGTAGNETHAFEVKLAQDKKVIGDLINQIVRKSAENGEAAPDMWLIAEDAYGNQTKTKVTYTPSYVCQVEVVGARSGKKFVRVYGNMENIEVKLTVLAADGQEKATGTATIKDTSKSEKLTFEKGYKLQKGDVVKVYGSVTKDGHLYITNPLLIDVN